MMSAFIPLSLSLSTFLRVFWRHFVLQGLQKVYFIGKERLSTQLFLSKQLWLLCYIFKYRLFENWLLFWKPLFYWKLLTVKHNNRFNPHLGFADCRYISHWHHVLRSQRIIKQKRSSQTRICNLIEKKWSLLLKLNSIST